MRRLIITTLALTASAAMHLRAGEPWTLDSCISYAVTHDITVRTRQIDAADARGSVDEARDAFLPTVSGQAQQSFSFGRGLTADNTYANRNTQSTSFGVGLSVPLFQGLAGVRRVDYARAGLRTALEQVEAARDNVELNVIAQYLQVLYCGETLATAREALRMSEYELERRRALVEAGKIPELDLCEAEAQIARDRLSVTGAVNDRARALLDLAQMLRLPDADGFDVAPLAAEESQSGTTGALVAEAISRNHAVTAARLSVDAADAGIRLAQTGWLPTLSLSAGLNANYYKVGGMPAPSFGRQMRDNFSKYVGLSLSVPLFDLWATRRSVGRARRRKLSAELQYEQTVSDLRKVIEQARLQADGAEARLEAAVTAESASRRALDGMRERYDFGRATAADYEQSRSAWLRTVHDVTSARYELQLRRRILAFYCGEVDR